MYFLEIFAELAIFSFSISDNNFLLGTIRQITIKQGNIGHLTTLTKTKVKRVDFVCNKTKMSSPLRSPTCCQAGETRFCKIFQRAKQLTIEGLGETCHSNYHKKMVTHLVEVNEEILRRFCLEGEMDMCQYVCIGQIFLWSSIYILTVGAELMPLRSFTNTENKTFKRK